MFGLFKKPDPRKNIDHVQETLSLITVRDKFTVAEGIKTLCKTLNEDCNSLDDAIAAMISNKQMIIRHFGLRDHRHPAYMQMEILLEVLVHCSGRTSAQVYATETFLKVLEPLSSFDRLQIQRNLSKFININLS